MIAKAIEKSNQSMEEKLDKDNKKNKKDKNKIHITTDYNLFTYLVGNRDIVDKHVKDLSSQIDERDLNIPIIVNEKMEVCDGQHRLEAYKILGLPVHYIIKEGLTLQDIRKLNSVNRKWTMHEYMMSHFKLDAEHYITLEWFVRAFGFSVSDSLAMLNGKGYLDQHDYREFREGGFKVHDLEKAKEIANAIIWIGNYFDKWKKGNFIRAMISVMNDKSFVWSIFKRRVENFSAKLTNQGSRDDFIIMIERLYNFKTSPDKRIRLKIYGKRS